MVWVIVTLVVALTSLVLALITNSAANPLYLIMMAVFLTLFTGAKSPW